MSYPVLVICFLLFGVLLFGKDLPKVAKQLGQGVMEFRKGLNELSDIKKFGSVPSGSRAGASGSELEHEVEDYDDHHEVIGKKFTPSKSSSEPLSVEAKPG